ncbi:MAG: hypothetical protein ACJAYU_003632 [Bradymonadia bacterium]
MFSTLLLALLFAGPSTSDVPPSKELIAQTDLYAGPLLYAPLFDHASSWTFAATHSETTAEYGSERRQTLTCGPTEVVLTEAGSVSVVVCNGSAENPIAGTYIATSAGLWRDVYPTPSTADEFGALNTEDQFLPPEPVSHEITEEEEMLAGFHNSTTVADGLTCHTRADFGCATANTRLCFSAVDGIVEASRTEDRETLLSFRAERLTATAPDVDPSSQPTAACEEWSAGGVTRFIWATEENPDIAVHVALTCGGTPIQTISMHREFSDVEQVRVEDFDFDGLPDLWIPLHLAGSNGHWRGWVYAESGYFVRDERFDFDGSPYADRDAQVVWNRRENEEDVDSDGYRLVGSERVLVRSRRHQDATLVSDTVLLAGRMVPAGEVEEGAPLRVVSDWDFSPALCPGTPSVGDADPLESLSNATIGGARPGTPANKLFATYGEPDRVTGDRSIEGATGEVTVDWHYDRCGFSATLAGAPGAPSSVRWISATGFGAATYGLGLRVGMTAEDASVVLSGERFFDAETYESLTLHVEDGLVAEFTISAPAE